MLARRATTVIALFALGTAACRDSSGPATPIDITLNAAVVEGPTTTTATDGSTLLACRVSIEAVATGGGGASWEGGTLLFFAGRDRAEAIDTSDIPIENVVQFWNAAGIRGGQTQRTELRFSSPFPFSVTLSFRYRTSPTVTDTAEVSFNCGPTIPANSPPPTIEALTVDPVEGARPGQVISVAFTARSDAGIRRTEVRLSGACELTATNHEPLAVTVTRTVPIALPATCATDLPLVITVVAFDGAIEEASRVVTLMLASNVASSGLAGTAR